MRVDQIGVHRTHCCIAHGCKYGDDDCPVVNAEILQDYLCEFCKDLFFNQFHDIPEYTMENIKKKFIKNNRKLKISKIQKINN